jgi:transcriptional regulator GlxA family with amidase domain
MTRRIGFLGFDGLQAMDVVGPADVFRSDALAGAEDVRVGGPAYDVVIIGILGHDFTASNGVEIHARHVIPTSIQLDTPIVPGGAGLRRPGVAQRAGDWIVKRAPSFRRIASVCTGIFGLAPTGLLDGRRVATHWAVAETVGRLFPSLCVDPDSLFVKDDRFYTFAGISAGIDLALAMVEEDLGPDLALAAAKEMVVYLKRSGGQNQYSEPLRFQVESSDRFADLVTWVGGHLRDDLSVKVLAKRACLSERHFLRAFKERFHVTPAAFVEGARLTEGCRRLLARRSTIEAVGRSVGYASDETFRRAFSRRFGVSPREYRSRFDVVSKPFV